MSLSVSVRTDTVLSGRQRVTRRISFLISYIMCNNKTKTITMAQKADINTVFSAADALNNVFECLYKIGIKYDFPPTQQQSITDAVEELQNISFQLATWIFDPAAENAPEIVADKEKEMQHKITLIAPPSVKN